MPMILVVLIGRIKLGYVKKGQRHDIPDILDSVWMRLSTSRGPRRLLKRAISPYWSPVRESKQRQTPSLINCFFPFSQLLPSQDYYPMNVFMLCTTNDSDSITGRPSSFSLPALRCNRDKLTVFDYSFLQSIFDYHGIVFEAL